MLGDSGLFVTNSDHCGISFKLDYDPPESELRQDWSANQLAALPGKVRVTAVNIFGCVREHPDP